MSTSVTYMVLASGLVTIAVGMFGYWLGRIWAELHAIRVLLGERVQMEREQTRKLRQW